MRYFFPLFLLFSCLLTILPGCEPKENLVQTSGSLELQADTVLFDTVFTTIRTVTKRLWVYNRNNGAVKTDVSLSGTAGPTYSLIINGDAGPSTSGVTIRGKDSLLVLVRAVLGDNGQATTARKFLVTDELHFRTNGTDQIAHLVAYGQNAYFHRADIINGNSTTVWRNDKPHVIINSPVAQAGGPVSVGVYVEAGSTLLIQPGARIYCHAGATMQINGTLKINPTFNPPTNDTTAAKLATVRFHGDRLETGYAEIPGQWGGIFFTSSSRDNVIRYTEIKNANFGTSLLNTQNNARQPDLLLENVVMRNISGSNPAYVGTGQPPGGIVGVLSNITATNCLFSNCGEYAVLGFGGTFNLNFCTFANYTPSFRRETSSLTFTNQLTDASGAVRKLPFVLNLTNSIVWGSFEDELFLQNNADPNYTFTIRNTLLRTKEYLAATDAAGKPGLGAPALANLINIDPAFKRTPLNSNRPDYRLQNTSPATMPRRPKAPDTSVPSIDLPNMTRTNNLNTPSLGAYEHK